MKNDPIVAEVRKAREKISAKCNYDLDELCKYLQSVEKQEGRFVTYQPKKVISKVADRPEGKTNEV